MDTHVWEQLCKKDRSHPHVEYDENHLREHGYVVLTSRDESALKEDASGNQDDLCGLLL